MPDTPTPIEVGAWGEIAGRLPVAGDEKLPRVDLPPEGLVIDTIHGPALVKPGRSSLPLEVGAIVDTDNGYTRLRVAEVIHKSGVSVARLTYGGHDIGLYGNTWPDWRVVVTCSAADAPPETPFSGWILQTGWRDRLLLDLSKQGIRPAHRYLDAHHVTHRYPDDERVWGYEYLRAVAYIDGPGIDLLVVEVDRIDEPTTERPDGGTYHLTLSLDDGHQAVESNTVLEHDQGTRVELDPPITLHNTSGF